MSIVIEASWKERLAPEFEKPYWQELTTYVRDAYKSGTVYPHPKHIFRAFELCPFNEVKVVILGQDPYHGRGQANGLCFAVSDGVRIPPSLQNIYKEIESDLGTHKEWSGDLAPWAAQGVLLLNATLTVSAGLAGSHQNKGWELFTDTVIKILAEEREHLVFLLWGRYAKEKGSMIDTSRHCVLEAAHPSPFSADKGFFGCKHFSKTNDYLKAHNQKPIEW